MIIYNKIVHIALKLQLINFGQICTHEWYPIPRHYGQGWGAFNELYKEKMTVIYWECIVPLEVEIIYPTKKKRHNLMELVFGSCYFENCE